VPCEVDVGVWRRSFEERCCRCTRWRPELSWTWRGDEISGHEGCPTNEAAAAGVRGDAPVCKPSSVLAAERPVVHLPRMTGAELHEIIEQLPDEAVEGASILLKRLAARQIDPDQEWCWSDEGQEKLRASLADIDTGRVRSFQTAEDSLEPSDRNAGLDEMSGIR
jgi:hypothetical protein